MIVFKGGKAVTKNASTRGLREGETQALRGGQPHAAGGAVPKPPRAHRTEGLRRLLARSPRLGRAVRRSIRRDRNRGRRGWAYKVGNKAGTTGAADPSGPFGTGRRLRKTQRVLWFYCVLRSRGCQRTLSIRVTEQAGGLTVKVVATTTRVAACWWRAPPTPARSPRSPAATVAPASLPPSGSYRVHAERRGWCARSASGPGCRSAMAGRARLRSRPRRLRPGRGLRREGGAELQYFRDFGHERLGSARLDKIGEADTVMRLRAASTSARATAAASSRRSRGRSARERPAADWFYFVNGFEASAGAAEYELSPGDVVHWDYRSWKACDAGAGHRGRVPRAVPPRAGGQALLGAGGVLG